MKRKIADLPHGGELTLLDVIRILRRGILWIIACGAVAAVVTGLVTRYIAPPKYSAHTTMYIYTTTESAGSITNSDLAAAESLTVTYQQILQSDRALESVCHYLNENWPEQAFAAKDLADMVEVIAVDHTQLLRISVVAREPRLAAVVANAFAAVGPEEILAVTKAGGVEIVDYGRVPETADGPNVLKNAVLGLLGGMLAAGIGFFAWGIYDTRIYEIEDAAGFVEIPILTEITGITDGLLSRNSLDARKETYAQLRTDLKFGLPEKSSVILVTGAEGKSQIAANLAVSFGMLGEKTLLIDGDLRKPLQHQLWGVRSKPGLSELLNGLDRGILHRIPDLPLTVLSAGSELSDASEIFASGHFAGVMDYLRSQYDVIILDAPAMAASDTQLLARYADGVLLVIPSGKIRREEISVCLDRLNRTGDRVMGLVICKADSNVLKRTEKREINA